MKKIKILSALLAPMLCLSGGAMAKERSKSVPISNTETVKKSNNVNSSSNNNGVVLGVGGFALGLTSGILTAGIPLKMQKEELNEKLTNKNLDYEVLKRENKKLKEENDTLKAQNNPNANEVYNMLKKMLSFDDNINPVSPEKVLRVVKNFCNACPLVFKSFSNVNTVFLQPYECFGDCLFKQLSTKGTWIDGKSENRLNCFFSGDKSKVESVSNLLSDKAKEMIIKNYLKCYFFGQMIMSSSDEMLNREIQNYKNMDELFKT